MFTLVRELFQGFAMRMRLENHLQLQKSGLIRPKQIKLEIAETYLEIEGKLADAKLRKEYDSITLTLPGEVA
jgi:hypothetical protein